MLYLLWALLNAGLFMVFIAICFSATKLIRKNSGLLASLIFVFGLLSFIVGGKNRYKSKPGMIRTWTFQPTDSLMGNPAVAIDIPLEKTLISAYNLNIMYKKDPKTGLSLPVSAYSLTTGFMAGTNWQPGSITVHRTNSNNKFEYEVRGTVEWSLPGVTLYTQAKTYKGFVPVN